MRQRRPGGTSARVRAAVLRAAAGVRTPEVQAIVRAVVKRLAELVAAAAGAKPARR